MVGYTPLYVCSRRASTAVPAVIAFQPDEDVPMQSFVDAMSTGCQYQDTVGLCKCGATTMVRTCAGR